MLMQGWGQSSSTICLHASAAEHPTTFTEGVDVDLWQPWRDLDQGYTLVVPLPAYRYSLMSNGAYNPGGRPSQSKNRSRSAGDHGHIIFPPLGETILRIGYIPSQALDSSISFGLSKVLKLLVMADFW